LGVQLKYMYLIYDMEATKTVMFYAEMFLHRLLVGVCLKTEENQENLCRDGSKRGFLPNNTQDSVRTSQETLRLRYRAQPVNAV
jgi:hypothetical protein